MCSKKATIPHISGQQISKFYELINYWIVIITPRVFA